jgi:hypothetical protein
VTSLAGYTARVSELLEQVKVLDEVGVKPFEVIDGAQPGSEVRLASLFALAYLPYTVP